MLGTSDTNTPATVADVRRIVREEIAAWWRGIGEEFRKRVEAEED